MSAADSIVRLSRQVESIRARALKHAHPIPARRLLDEAAHLAETAERIARIRAYLNDQQPQKVAA